MSQSDGGKGDSPRKQQDQKAYEEGWDRIFGGSHRKKAIKYVMNFYGVPESDAKTLYIDEVEAAERLYEKGALP